MATQATSKGAIRPKSTVSLATLEKRVRRRLAADYLQLRKNRLGTITHQLHGDWSVIEPKNHVLMRHHFTLEELARDLDLLAADEIVGGAE